MSERRINRYGIYITSVMTELIEKQDKVELLSSMARRLSPGAGGWQQ